MDSLSLKCFGESPDIYVFFDCVPSQGWVPSSGLSKQVIVVNALLCRVVGGISPILMLMMGKRTHRHRQLPNHSFCASDRPPITSRFGPPPNPLPRLAADRVTYTATGREICKSFNTTKCTRGEDCIFAHVCWHQGCQSQHPGRGCTKKP